MGGLAKEAAGAGAGTVAPAVDVSAEGTLVWLRRPNGSWWPSIVISPLDVPDDCPPPPRCPATPIMLLGRRDGRTYVDWCNLERCKRVKPFRCGELEFEERITNAVALASTRVVRGRYARIEDAVLQALEIERGRALQPRTKTRHGEDACSPNQNIGNGASRKPSSSPSAHVASARDSSTVPAKRKRKTPNDSEDDAPKGSLRMRDLRDIGSKTVPPPDLSNAGIISVLGCDMPSVAPVKRSRQSHATTKMKYATADQDQPCGISRKKDRSRPLSELCNGDMRNGFRSNGQNADRHLMAVGSCSSSSSGTSSLSTSSDKIGSHGSAAFKADQTKRAEIYCMTGLINGGIPHADHFVKATHAAEGVLQADHLQTYQPCVPPKHPTCTRSKQATDSSKGDIPSQWGRGNFQVKPVSPIDQGEALEDEHHKTRAVKHKAPRNDIILLKKKPAKCSLNRTAERGVNTHFAAFPRLDCVGAAQQQRSERKHGHQDQAETISSSSECENGLVSSMIFELPLQVLPPQQGALDLGRCGTVKPIKSVQLNPALYDVELSAPGNNNKGRRVPLVSLMSKWNRKPVVGYPVSVEVSDDVCQRPSANTDKAGTSSAHGLVKKEKAEELPCLVPPLQACRAKPKSRRKTSGKEVDKLWQPHIKKPASSPRKMRRLSSFASSQRGGEDRKSAVVKNRGATIACIPLRVVFSRMKEALHYPVK